MHPLASEPFEPRLIEAIEPIRQFVLAAAIYHLFDSTLFDLFSRSEPTLDILVEEHGFERAKVETFLDYLRNEQLVVREEGRYRLSAKGAALAEFRGWYTMLIGGYGSTFLQLGEKLKSGTGWATRVGEKVAVGSCLISHFDAIPLTRKLIEQVPGRERRMLDLGCGNALYLVEFCEAMPDVEAWGVEPHRAAVEEAKTLVEQRGLGHRIRLSCASAAEFLNSEPALEAWRPSFVVLGFVLHELLAQQGEAAVIALLDSLTTRLPQLRLVVIEVDNRMQDPTAMRHGLARAYYNSYYLFHPFTHQRLESRKYWSELFARANLVIEAEETVDPNVDSTQLTVGYLLRRK